MNKLNLSDMIHDRVSIQVTDSGANVLVSVVGDIDMQDPSLILGPFFEKLHQGALAAGLSAIEVDFRQLNFLNSSGIKALAKWAIQLGSTPADKRYQIRIYHNKLSTWQNTSLPTLAFLVPGGIVLQ